MYFIASLIASGLAIHFWGYDGPLEMNFYYSKDEAIRFFSGLTSEETHTYLRSECFDFLFLFSYSVLFFRWLNRLFSDSSFCRWLGIVPGMFDLIETFTSSLILMGVVPAAPAWLGFMTCAKWTTSIIVMLLICFQFLRRKINRSL